MLSLATGAVLDLATAAYSGKGTGEHALLREIISAIQENDLVLADAYYSSFFLIAFLIQIGVDIVCASDGRREVNFKKGCTIGMGDHIVKWKKPRRPEWMDKDTYYNLPNLIELRETRVVLERPGFRSKTIILISTLRDTRRVSPSDLSELYGFRWFIEVDFRSIKNTMRMDILRCKTPERVRKEIWAHLLAYNLIRKEMLQAGIRYQRNPRDMSFKLALQMMGSFLQAGILSPNNIEVYERFQMAIISKKIGIQIRPSEPRMVKRRPKRFPRMQKSRHLYRKEMA